MPGPSRPQDAEAASTAEAGVDRRRRLGRRVHHPDRGRHARLTLREASARQGRYPAVGARPTAAARSVLPARAARSVSPTDVSRRDGAPVRGARRLVAGGPVGRPTTTGVRAASATSPRTPARRQTRRSAASGPAISGALSGSSSRTAGGSRCGSGWSLRRMTRDPSVACPAGDPGRLPVRARAGRRDARQRARRDGPGRLPTRPSRGSTGPDRAGQVDSAADA